jgi:hypothetical protein
MYKQQTSDRAEGGLSSARLFFAIAVLILAACTQRTSAPSLDYQDGVIVASGWSGRPPSAGWESVLVVRASDDPSAPPIMGGYKESGGVITFTPRFAPSPGVPLYASFRPENAAEITRTFGEAANTIAATARVMHLYPSADTWPANTLKMYLEFSAPMSTAGAYSHIRVLDEQGRPIEQPFVEIEPELWDPSGKRLTILFDPGRIKRGLVDNEASGPPLAPGRAITIEVDPALRDSNGAPLAEKFSRTIRVTEAVRQPVDVRAWRIDSPKSASADLVLSFPRPLDHALAQRAISVTRDGSPVAGGVTLENDETRFRFTPASQWSPGRHVIRVDGVIEDLAGNRLGKVFDVDTSDPAQSVSATPFAEIEFDAPAR